MTVSTEYLAALAVAGTACAIDLRTRRIPNVLTFGASAVALLFHAAVDGGTGVAHAGGGWLVGVAFFFVPFALGGLGAGDVKLLGALGAWLGPMKALWVGLYASVAGGVVAIVVALAVGYLPQMFRNIYLLLTHWRVAGVKPVDGFTLSTGKGPRLAYAAPILAGTIAALWLK